VSEFRNNQSASDMSKWLWNVVWYFTQYRAYVRTLISAPWLSILVRIIPFFYLKNKAMEVHSTLHISVFAIFVLPRLFRRTGIYSYTKMHIMILFVVFFSLNTSRFRIMATHPHDLGDHAFDRGRVPQRYADVYKSSYVMSHRGPWCHQGPQWLIRTMFEIVRESVLQTERSFTYEICTALILQPSSPNTLQDLQSTPRPYMAP